MMNEPEIDWTTALEAVEGQRDFLAELIQLFFDEYPKLMSALKETLSHDDMTGFQRAAHTLKGSLRYFGPNPAAEMAGELENLARYNSLIDAESRILALQVAIEQLVPQLNAFADTFGKSGPQASQVDSPSP